MIRGDKLAERGPLREIRKAINRLQDQVNSLRIAEGVNYQVKHTALGQILNIKPAAEGAEAVQGMVFKGEWDATVTYEKNEVVVVRGGLAGGTYICIAQCPAGSAPEDPPTHPEQGIYWVCLARDSAGGVW